MQSESFLTSELIILPWLPFTGKPLIEGLDRATPRFRVKLGTPLRKGLWATITPEFPVLC
jgi:hypothetical protein